MSFGQLVAPLLSHLPSIQSLEWIPRVPDAQRAEYEEAARKDGLPGFQITEKDAHGGIRRAARRCEYFPVYYVEPRRGNEAAIGYDLASNGARLQALRRARDSGEAAATARITLVQEKEHSFGFLIFLPLYTSGMPTETVVQRRQALRGFVLGVFRLAGMVETALRRLRPGGVEIYIEDASAPTEERFLYFHRSRTEERSSPSAAGGIVDSHDDLCSVNQCNVGGRTWRLICTSAPGYVTAHRTWQPWGSLTGGLVFTAVLVWYYVTSIRRAVRAQRTLYESESRYRSLFNGSPIALREEDYSEVKRHVEQLRAGGITDFRRYFQQHPEAVRECAAKVKVVDLNPAGLRLYGATSTDELLRGLAAIFTDETYATFQEALIAIADGKSVIDVETPVQTLQGEQKHVLLRWAVASGCEQTLASVYISQTEITDRKRTEEALRASERRHRLFADNVSDMVWTIDFSGRFTYVSPSTRPILGYAPDELVGSSFERILTPSSLDVARKIFAEAIARLKAGAPPQPNILELEHLRKDGVVTWVEVIVSRVCDESGKVIAFQGVSRDITERRRMADELRAAKETAEASNRAKSEFLANMSHEIRTPMTAILGFADLLMTPDLSRDEQHEFLETIQRNGKALLQLIGDILDLSKIEANRVVAEKSDCSLRQIVNDIVSMVRVRAEEKGLKLEVDYSFPLPEKIQTDTLRLRQILVNLLGNAVKFTERGTVRITVHCLRNDDGTGQMQFAISDSGAGIPADKMRDLFQPFMQVDASVTRRFGGTGLGLAISKRLAKALGGDIEVASELGKGSTFTLTIDAGSLERVCMQQLPKAASAGGEERLSNEQEPPLHGRLLLAEDAADNQALIRHILRQMNLEVEVAENGQVACNMAETSQSEGKPYDLILMDIQMPQMSGYEATRWLRAHDWRGPIVAMTAYAMSGDRQKCLEAGCDDYLAKPATRSELQRVLVRHLSCADTTAHHIADGKQSALPGLLMPTGVEKGSAAQSP